MAQKAAKTLIDILKNKVKNDISIQLQPSLIAREPHKKLECMSFK